MKYYDGTKMIWEFNRDYRKKLFIIWQYGKDIWKELKEDLYKLDTHLYIKPPCELIFEGGYLMQEDWKDLVSRCLTLIENYYQKSL